MSVNYKELGKGDQYFDIFDNAMTLKSKHSASVFFRKKKLEAYVVAEDAASATVVEMYPNAYRWSACVSPFEKDGIILRVYTE